MKRVFGIETEYGITVDGDGGLDVVRESIEIVRSYTEHGALDEMGLRRWRTRIRMRADFARRNSSRTRTRRAYYEIDKARPLCV